MSFLKMYLLNQLEIKADIFFSRVPPLEQINNSLYYFSTILLSTLCLMKEAHTVSTGVSVEGKLLGYM